MSVCATWTKIGLKILSPALAAVESPHSDDSSKVYMSGVPGSSLWWEIQVNIPLCMCTSSWCHTIGAEVKKLINTFCLIFCEFWSHKTCFGEYFDGYFYGTSCRNVRVIGWQLFSEFTTCHTHLEPSMLHICLEFLRQQQHIFLQTKDMKLFLLWIYMIIFLRKKEEKASCTQTNSTSPQRKP